MQEKLQSEVRSETMREEQPLRHLFRMKDAPTDPLQSNKKCYGLCGQSMGSESHRQMVLYSDRQVKDFFEKATNDDPGTKQSKHLLWKRKVTELQRKITFLVFSSCNRKLLGSVKCANQKGLPYSIRAQLCV